MSEAASVSLGVVQHPGIGGSAHNLWPRAPLRNAISHSHSCNQADVEFQLSDSIASRDRCRVCEWTRTSMVESALVRLDD